MKATDLRIRNKYNLFLGIRDDGPEYRTVEISGIDADRLGQPRVKINKDVYWHSMENFEPIPLTEDWLLKFGFTEYGTAKGIFYIKKHLGEYNALNIDMESMDVKHNSHWICDIKYVHQLQNLYHALTNNELQIKLT